MKPLRSLLFVPGDSEKKLARAGSVPADALILDLEDSVAPERKALGRRQVSAYLADRRADRPAQLWVRINPLDTPDALEDLAAVTGAAPAGILLPKSDGPEDVAALSRYLDALEVRDGLARDSVRIITVATETPAAPFALGQYAHADLPRLVGLTWGAEDLSAAVGASTNRDEDGDWDFTYRWVRSACLLAAHAAGVQAIDTLYDDYRDEDGLRRASAIARRQGFTGRVCIHPGQVEAVNAAFSPSPEEIAHARRVVDAFRDAQGAATVGLDGRMLDIPHLKQAERLLALGDENG